MFRYEERLWRERTLCFETTVEFRNSTNCAWRVCSLIHPTQTHGGRKGAPTCNASLVVATLRRLSMLSLQSSSPAICLVYGALCIPGFNLPLIDLIFERYNTQNSLFYNDLTPMTDSTKAALCWIDGCFLPCLASTSWRQRRWL